MLKLKNYEYRHYITVLRKRPGDLVQLVRDREIIEAEIKIAGKSSASCDIIRVISKVLMPDIIICLGMIKRQYIETVIRMASQIGINGLCLLKTDRSIPNTVKLEGKDKPKNARFRMERLKKIAEENSILSFNTVPFIESGVDFKEAVIKDKSGLKLIFYAGSRGRQLKEILPVKIPESISLYIGPVGDFTDKEIEFAVKNGFEVAKLGRARLRSETAAISALSGIRMFYGNNATD